MISYESVILIVGGHFLFDWICQPRAWARRKHQEPRSLLAHVLIVSLYLTGVGYYMDLGQDIAPFVVVNTILHAMIDWISSNWYHNLHEQEKHQAAFTVAAVDQFLHIAIIFGTLSRWV